jgi:hypothetical protein
MGRKKLLRKLSEFFDMGARDRNQRKDEIKDLLSRLKRKEVGLKEQLDTEKNKDKQKALKQKINLVHSQRKKGISMANDLKKEGHE